MEIGRSVQPGQLRSNASLVHWMTDQRRHFPIPVVIKRQFHLVDSFDEEFRRKGTAVCVNGSARFVSRRFHHLLEHLDLIFREPLRHCCQHVSDGLCAVREQIGDFQRSLDLDFSISTRSNCLIFLNDREPISLMLSAAIEERENGIGAFGGSQLVCAIGRDLTLDGEKVWKHVSEFVYVFVRYNRRSVVCRNGTRVHTPGENSARQNCQLRDPRPLTRMTGRTLSRAALLRTHCRLPVPKSRGQREPESGKPVAGAVLLKGYWT